MTGKLNLGCGYKHLEGFLNVDSESRCDPDLVLDLEQTPWPFESSSITEVRMIHVLEHLGRSPEAYLDIIRELHRICADGALIEIEVPHPRHDVFLTDPTHLRPILPTQLQMFSKKANDNWIENGHAITPLGNYMNVDFEIEDLQWIPDPKWRSKLENGEISTEDFTELAQHQNNIIMEIKIKWRVLK